MHPNLLALMTQSVSFEPFVSRDAWGNPTYSGTLGFPNCRVKGGPDQVLSSAGQVVTSMVQVWVPTSSGITVNDRMTLPSDFTPQSPPIIRIDRVPDAGGMSTGNSHLKVWA